MSARGAQSERELDRCNFKWYVRFCDDMIIVHPERKKCATAMARYLDAVAKRKLPIHELKPNGFAYGRDYYDVKTKAPFEWRACEMGTAHAAPWVGFLGNQIDYAGAVRIRRETISRHIAKMKGERGKFVRRMGAVCKGDASKLKGKLSAGRLAGICKRYCMRLVAKGIGFMKAGAIPEDIMGWVSAFPAAVESHSDACAAQMRQLDAIRDRLLAPFDGLLCGKDGKPRFFGRPFSYSGFLRQLSRPVQPIPGKGTTRKGTRQVVNDFCFYGSL